MRKLNTATSASNSSLLRPPPVAGSVPTSSRASTEVSSTVTVFEAVSPSIEDELHNDSDDQQVNREFESSEGSKHAHVDSPADETLSSADINEVDNETEDGHSHDAAQPTTPYSRSVSSESPSNSFCDPGTDGLIIQDVYRTHNNLVHVPPTILKSVTIQRKVQGDEFWKVEELTTTNDNLRKLIPGCQNANIDLVRSLKAFDRLSPHVQQALYAVAFAFRGSAQYHVIQAVAHARVAQLALPSRADDEIDDATMAVFLNERLAVKYILQDKRLLAEAEDSYVANITTLHRVVKRQGIHAILPEDRLYMPLLPTKLQLTLEDEAAQIMKTFPEVVRRKLIGIEWGARTKPCSTVMTNRLKALAGVVQIDHCARLTHRCAESWLRKC